jgi:hypothetical protein
MAGLDNVTSDLTKDGWDGQTPVQVMDGPHHILSSLQVLSCHHRFLMSSSTARSHDLPIASQQEPPGGSLSKNGHRTLPHLCSHPQHIV